MELLLEKGQARPGVGADIGRGHTHTMDFADMSASEREGDSLKSGCSKGACVDFILYFIYILSMSFI